MDALRREYLEAQERNLLKTYGRYENECTTRSDRDNEEYERFNNFQTSPQRVPENLSYKLPDEKCFEEPNPTVEKPLDLTGEKEKGPSDVEMENEKVESSPRHPRRGRGRKSGSKKGDNEVRTSPRFRKGAKSRKSESDTKGYSKDKDKGSEGCVQNGSSCKVRSQSRERGSSKVEVVESMTKNQDPRLKNNSGYIKMENSEKLEPEINVVDNPREPKAEVNIEIKDEPDASSRTSLKAEKLNRTFKKEVVSDTVVDKVDAFSHCKRQEEVRDIKVEVVDEKIVQNGFENVKIEDKNRGPDDRNFSVKSDNSLYEEKTFKSELVPENSMESHADSKNEDLEQYSSVPADKSAPTKRKVSR